MKPHSFDQNLQHSSSVGSGPAVNFQPMGGRDPRVDMASSREYADAPPLVIAGGQSHRNGHQHNGSKRDPVTYLVPAGTKLAVDRSYTYGEAFRDQSEDQGLANVLEYHQKLYESHHIASRVVHEAEQARLRDLVSQLKASERALVGQLRNTQRYNDVPLPEGVKPLTAGRNLAAIAVGLAAPAALILDVFACATVLQNSGIAVFVAEPWKAWVTSSSPVMLSLLGKALVGLAPAGIKKSLVLTFGMVAFAAALGWAWLFSQTFPALGQSVDQLLRDFDSTAPTEIASIFSAQTLVLLQIIVGSFGAVCLMEFASSLRSGYQSLRRETTDQFRETSEDLVAIRAEAEAAQSSLAQSKGFLDSLAADRDLLLKAAASSYHLMRQALESQSGLRIA
jgi:hypothetical protein